MGRIHPKKRDVEINRDLTGEGKKVVAVGGTQRNSVFKKKRLWVLLLVMAVVLLSPFKSTVAPSQRVLVVTEDWRPIQGVRVRQIWQDYSVEAVGHEEDVPTDENGRVFFRVEQ